MKIALVDDEPLCIKELQTALRSALAEIGIAVNKTDTFSSAKEFFETWRAGDYDIIFLDIYMDKENGIELARKIRERDTYTFLAFCTSSNEFAAETYEVRAGYYLNKPVSAEKLISMFHKIKLSNIEHNRAIKLPDGYRCLLRHILYTEYINHTVVFHLKDSDSHTIYMSHSDVENLLLQYKNFKQINKGSIVNFAMVKRIDGSIFTIQNGEKLPISRRRYKEVSEDYTKYRFEKMNEEVDD